MATHGTGCEDSTGLYAGKRTATLCDMWLRSLLLSALMLGCGSGEPEPSASTDAVTVASDTDAGPIDPIGPGIDRLNAARAAAGVEPVEIITALNGGCEKHVAYMAAVGKVVHSEDPAHPAYTAAGAAAGEAANLAQDVAGLDEAVGLWRDAIYFRLPMLNPGVGHVGVAFQDGWVCLDLFSAFAAVEGHAPVPWPAGDAAGVPTTLHDAGALDPRPPGYTPPNGTIVSLLFAPDAIVDTATFTAALSTGGAPVEAFTRLPNDPNDPYRVRQGNAVTLIPRHPLGPLTTYDVFMAGKVDGEDFQKLWQFTTGED